MEIKSTRILLAEDNPDHAELIQRTLIRHDPEIKIEVASSGDQCLERLKGGDFDLVLLDYTLPRMNGLEVLERIDNNQVPIVMVTGQGDEKVAVEAMKRGASDYITKSKDYLLTLPLIVEKTLERCRTNAEKKRLEEKLRQSERLRALGEMAGGVAHDFNNILAIILGRTQLIRLTLENFETVKMRKSFRFLLESLDIIERAATDGAHTVKRIQELTGIKREERFFTVDINRIVREAYEATKPMWKNQKESEGIIIEFATELGNIGPVAGNEAELREVLSNMIFNAVEAMPSGGTIRISTWSENDHVHITVSDTGEGMPEEVRVKAFDPFFTTKEVSHSGLGLSVSYGIISRHGGEIEVESTEGKGTTFRIRLPVSKGEVKETLKRKRPLSKEKARVLVIEDQKEVREILKEMLTSLGFEVSTAIGAKDGLSLFERSNFDMVFTDLGMPEISGWEVSKRVKRIRPQTPVAIVTGWGNQLDENKIKDSKADLVIAKPFKLDQIVELVDRALNISAASKNRYP